jgi:hypothetical protein
MLKTVQQHLRFYGNGENVFQVPYTNSVLNVLLIRY